MKKLLAVFFFLPSLAFAGTIITDFSPLGSVYFSSGTKSITFDAQASSFPTAGTSPFAFNITIGSCSNRFLAVECDNSNADSLTGITVGGNALTLSTSSVISIFGTSIWYYVNPPTGAQSISVTAASGIANRTGCEATSWCSVNQTSPVEASTATFNYPGSGLSNATVTTIQFGDLILDAVMDGNVDTIFTTQPGQTALVNTVRAFDTMAFSSRTVDTAGTYTMGWSGIETPTTQSAIAVRAAP